MDSFQPRPASDYYPQLVAEVKRLQVLNPERSLDDLEHFVNSQIAFFSSGDWHFREALAPSVLMIDHEVGVNERVLRIPKIDSDYFDEEAG